jgi:hypothetical protein
VEDVGAHKGVIVTTVGFDSNAINVANKNGIALLKVSDQGDIDIVQHLTGSTKSILKFLEFRSSYNRDEIRTVKGIITARKHIIDYIAERYGEVATFLAYDGPISIHQIKPEYKSKIIEQLRAMDEKREFQGISLYEWLLDYDAIETCGLPSNVELEPALSLRMVNVRVAATLFEISQMEKPL